VSLELGRAGLRYAPEVRRLALYPILVAPLVLVACKSERTKLEQLVPDGATGMISVDAKGIVQSSLYGKLEASAEAAADAKGKAVLDELRACKLDPEGIESMVMAFDAFSQSGMAAIRMPNLGTAEALRCMDAVVVKEGGKSLWTVGEQDGKATVTAEEGEVLGWAFDDDTLVLSSKNWSSAVQARMKGESKGAVDNGLAEAVALADTGKHVWFAGEIPALAAPFLDETPAKGMRRAAGSFHFGDELEIRMAAAFADEATAKATHDQIAPLLDEAKKLAVTQGLPQKAADSFALTLDGAVIRGEVTVDLAPLLESSTQAFTGYMNRSKTVEAKIQLSMMFDSASSYFNEEHVSLGEVAVLGAGGALTGLAPHQCPNDGSSTGEAGITPPLSVDCSKGPGGRCTPVAGKPSGPGEYAMSLWTDSKVWNAMNMQQEMPHYFHYNFRWSNVAAGYGSCQFTAQAFGDLDGDGVYSTYERAGVADENGVNGAAGLYVDNELE
jgi:hypothetical protein